MIKQTQIGDLNVKIDIRTIPFMKQMNLRKQFIKPGVKMNKNKKDIEVDDIDMDMIGLTTATMTESVKSITLDGIYRDEFDETEKKFENKTFEIHNEDSWLEIPDDVCQYIFDELMPLYFRKQTKNKSSTDVS